MRFCARNCTGVFVLIAALAGCVHDQASGKAVDSAGGRTGADSTAAAGSASAAAAVPVRMAVVTSGIVSEVVSGPGRTDALDIQKLRAPFTGTLEMLRVVIGDRVQSGETIGSIISQTSQAELTGAQVMLRDASTPAQRSDAERAVELAKRNLIQTPLHAPRGGVVVSRGASQGDLVTQGDSIVSIASAGSIVFIARIAQSDLRRIRPGLRATIDAPGRALIADGNVHGFLPSDTSAMSVPVRIDLRNDITAVPIGMFGTAHIVVGQRNAAAIVPAAALLRDDVNGITRIAVVAADGRAHWVTVTVGIQQGDAIEITAPSLAPGSRVIVSGQVGLPDGSRVREAGDSSDAAPKKTVSSLTGVTTERSAMAASRNVATTS